MAAGGAVCANRRGVRAAPEPSTGRPRNTGVDRGLGSRDRRACSTAVVGDLRRPRWSRLRAQRGVVVCTAYRVGSGIAGGQRYAAPRRFVSVRSQVIRRCSQVIGAGVAHRGSAACPMWTFQSAASVASGDLPDEGGSTWRMTRSSRPAACTKCSTCTRIASV